MTTEDRLAGLLKAEADQSFSPAGDGMAAIEARVRTRQRARTFRRVGLPLVVAAAAATTALLLSAGSDPSAQHVNVVPAGPHPTTVPPTVTTIPVTTEPTTTTTVSAAKVAAALDAYLSAETGVVAHSAPTAYSARLVAVAAVSHAADGRPIQVLVWNGTQWKQLTDLAIPGGSPAFPFAAGYPVSAADVTGDGRPDFLVILEGADNNPGVIVSEDGAGGWRLVPNTTTNPPTVFLGRSPVFQGGRLIAFFNDCNPNCAQGRTTPRRWTYDRMAGVFTTVTVPSIACGFVGFTSTASSQGAFSLQASAVDCVTAKSVASASRGRQGNPYQTSGFDCLAGATGAPNGKTYFSFLCMRLDQQITFDSNGG